MGARQVLCREPVHQVDAEAPADPQEDRCGPSHQVVLSGRFSLCFSNLGCFPCCDLHSALIIARPFVWLVCCVVFCPTQLALQLEWFESVWGSEQGLGSSFEPPFYEERCLVTELFTICNVIVV